MTVTDLTPPGFWRVRFTDLVTIGVVACGLIGGIVIYDRGVQANKTDVASVNKSVIDLATKQVELATKVHEMDRDGTIESLRGNYAARLVAVENFEKEWAPKVERIDTNLDWITKYVQNQGGSKGR